MQLTLKNITFKFPSSKTPLFKNLNLEFKEGFTCISGANGCGKSTLLKIISQDIKSEFNLKNLVAYYCEQSVDCKPKYFEDFMCCYEKETIHIKGLLAIKNDWLNRWECLSCGAKKRLQVAVSLHVKPDILLLDEPTNHLDKNNKNLILNALKTFSGIVIIVSHDRAFLDDLCNTTVFIDDGKTYTYKTNFTNALMEHDKYLKNLQNQANLHNNKMKKKMSAIFHQKQKVSKAKKRLSKYAIPKQDSSLKNKINLAKLTGKDKNDGLKLKKMMRDYGKTKNKKIIIKKDFSDSVGFELECYKKKFPLKIEKQTIKAGQIIVDFEEFSIYEHDKIVIFGENSCGKSTFLRYIVSKFSHLKYCYIAQEISNKEKDIFSHKLKQLKDDELSQIFTIVRKLNSNPHNIITSSNLSDGEIRKLFIANSIFERNYCIILDEPTNHLDIKSIMSLENAFREYLGVIIFISHDEIFSTKIANRFFYFEKIDKNHFKIKENNSATLYM